MQHHARVNGSCLALAAGAVLSLSVVQTLAQNAEPPASPPAAPPTTPPTTPPATPAAQPPAAPPPAAEAPAVAPATDKPAESPAAEVKPGDAKPAEAKATDTKPVGDEKKADAGAAPEQPMAPAEPLPEPPSATLGFAGASSLPPGSNMVPRETIALPDRWRIGWPRWDRYNRQAPNDDLLMNASGGDSPYTLGHPLNPYDRNVLKGDYPIFGEDYFLNVSAVSDTLFKFTRLPIPSGVSSANSNSFGNFGNGRVFAVNQTFLLSIDLFKGYAAYRPVDWLFHITPGFNINYLDVRENAVNVNPQRGTERTDKHAVIQDGFFEYHLGDTSPFFDIAVVKTGRQLFVSDFRGFIFNDVSDGIRFLGNAGSNRLQYNLAFFNQVEKDTNSGLNEFDWREQQVFVANLYYQDFIWQGYTIQGSFHWNHDNSDARYDDNGFPVRPDPVGSFTDHSIDAYYLGWTGDGHIGRLNLTHAFYYVFGTDDGNPLAGQEVDISAYMAAAELSVDIDWLRPKLSLFYASGDSDPTDGTGGGFDAIMDNPNFAGGPSSYYNSSGIGLLGTRLTSPGSFLTNLRASKTEGQSNFVNPGTFLVGTGLDMDLTPKLRASFTANSLWFADTSSVEYLLNQNGIDNHIGEELNLVFQYRPFLNNNILFTVGGSLFFPGRGFQDIYDDKDRLYQVFTGITLVY